MMPKHNINWKGYPHHRLPRIRVVSTRAPSIASRCPSKLSARQTLKSPLSPALVEHKKKDRFKLRFRRRKERVSRSSASVVRAKRRASQRARQNIQAFGWNTPVAELASRVTTEVAGSGSSIRAGFQPRRRLALLHDQITVTGTVSTAVHSTDGAGGSLLQRAQLASKDSNADYSLMRVAEVPVYWTAEGKPFRKSNLNPDRLSIHSARQPYTHTTSKVATIRNSRPAKGSRVSGSRLTPSYRVSKVQTSFPPQSRINTSSRRTLATPSISPKNKQRRDINFGDPASWKAVNTFAAFPRTGGSASPSIRSIVQSVFSDTPSRTASQKIAIDRFTKELDLYLQAVKQLPKQTLVPSASFSTFSANTIVELKPYRSEFEKAGLAVTSKEQKSLPNLDPPSPPPTPPKDEKWVRKSSPGPSNMAPASSKKISKPDSKGKQPSFASGSTGTDVIGFTPPQEKTYARGTTHRKKSSSEGSVLGWTPPHERGVVPPSPQVITEAIKSKSSESQASPKKSLPWLRRPNSPDKSPSSIKKDAADDKRPSTPLGGWVESYEIRDVPVPPKFKSRNEFHVTPRGGITHRSTEVRFKEQRYDDRDTSKTPTRSSRRAQTLSKTNVPQQEISKPIGIEYTDIGTQTDTKQDSTPRAPVPSGRNRTFPIKTNNCKGAFLEPTAVPPANSSRQLTATWRGVENATQTDIPEPAPEAFNVNEPPKNLSFTAIDKKDVDRNRTFPMIVGTGRGAGPFQPSSPLRSPNKSVDDRKFRTNKWSRESEEFQPELAEKLDSPVRRPPSPPVCTQCACCGESKNTETVPEQDPIAKPEQWTEQKPERSHTCSARSLHCQQCSPSDEVSSAATPTQQPREVEVFYGTSRRSTRPTIPIGDVTYSPEPVVQVTPKPSRIVKTAINDFKPEEPMADPMKKYLIPKLRLRSPPQAQPPPKPEIPRKFPKLPKQPLIANTTPPPAPPSESTIDSSLQLSDKKVFRGLHVATAAACDEDVDKWIEEITGCSARKFLSDLSAFDGLGVNTLADVAKRAAKQRRAKVRAWELVREKKIDEAEWEALEEDLVEGKMGFVVGKGVGGRKGKEREDKVQGMRLARAERGSEGVRERAEKMGWRERSVSEGPECHRLS